MRFIVEQKTLMSALERALLKGKYLDSKNSQLSNYAELRAGESLKVMNADNATIVCVNVECEIQSAGESVVEIDKMLKYLKTMSGEITVEVDDVIKIVSGGKKATLPRVVIHPNLAVIESLNNDFEFDENLTETVTFGKKNRKYETVIQLNASSLYNSLTACELVGSGVYRLDYNEEFQISSHAGNENYTESIEPINAVGEPATVEITAPVHKLFKNEIVNIYFNDDVPMTIISENSFLIRAPRVEGN